jgi:hypothetical protein
MTDIDKNAWMETIKESKSPKDYKLALKYARNKNIIFCVQQTSRTSDIWQVVHGVFNMWYGMSKAECVNLCIDLGWQYVVVGE